MKKLAIIGCGGIGTYHLGHFLDYTDVELVGCCDIIPERAESFAQKSNSKAFTDFKVMYDQVKPDMVFVCVPPTAHGEIELESIRRGIHFFVEKPLALDIDLMRQIRDEAKKAGLITASGFQCRYSNLMEPTKKYLAAHETVFVNCDRMGGIPSTPWWIKRALSGGQIVEQTIHQFDLIRFLLGEPETVFTMGTRGFIKNVEGYDTEDLTATVVRFTSGALATIATGCYAQEGAAFDSKITFSAKDSRLDHYILSKTNIFGTTPAAQDDDASFVVKGDGTFKQDNGNASESYKDDGTAGVRCDRTFVDAVISGDGSKILSPYEDALRSVAFTLACNESIDTGMPVKVKG